MGFLFFAEDKGEVKVLPEINNTEHFLK